MKKIILYLLLIVRITRTFTQPTITEQQVIDTIVSNNYLLLNASLKIEALKALQKTSWDIPDPEIFVEQNPFESLTLTGEQNLAFPTQYIKQGQLNREKITLAEMGYTVEKSEVIKNIRLLYLQIQYVSSKFQYLQFQDSVFKEIRDASTRSFEAGKADYLQKIFAETKYGEIHQLLINDEAELNSLKQQLYILTRTQYEFKLTELEKLNLKNDSVSIPLNPSYLYAEQNINVAQRQLEVTKSDALPDILLGYTVPLREEAIYAPGFKAGISIPLWFYSYKGNTDAARTELTITENNLKAQEQYLFQQKFNALTTYYSTEQTLRYYEKEGLRNAAELRKTATRLYEAGEMDFINYLRTLNESFEIQLGYFEALLNYNTSVIEIDYLNGK